MEKLNMAGWRKQPPGARLFSLSPSLTHPLSLPPSLSRNKGLPVGQVGNQEGSPGKKVLLASIRATSRAVTKLIGSLSDSTFIYVLGSRPGGKAITLLLVSSLFPCCCGAISVMLGSAGVQQVCSTCS